MRRVRFDAPVGHHITAFSSQHVTITGIQRISSSAQIGCLWIGAGGVVGYHEATTAQLFLVTAGEGWATGADRVRQPISVGHGVFWEQGEWHESGSDSGMTVIVVEGDDLRPDQVMHAESPAD